MQDYQVVQFSTPTTQPCNVTHDIDAHVTVQSLAVYSYNIIHLILHSKMQHDREINIWEVTKQCNVISISASKDDTCPAKLREKHTHESVVQH